MAVCKAFLAFALSHKSERYVTALESPAAALEEQLL